MKGLPNDIDVAVLVGSEITQICFNLHQLFLKFDRDVELSVESDCTITAPNAEALEVRDFRAEATRILGLLTDPVSKAERTGDGGLRLHFSTGTILQVLNSNSRYESFQLRLGKKLYVA